MEPQFDDELLQLKNALRQETFRFVIVGHNRYSIYQDVANWLRTIFPERPFLELRLTGNNYRQINDELVAFRKGIVLIPDFGWLFQKGNEPVCVAFNQRRDAFARLDIALLCFIEPSEFVEMPRKVPDWWSLRSLELDFHRETPDATSEFLTAEFENSSSLGGQTKEEKEAEIQRLLKQIEATEPTNDILLSILYSQIANLLFELSAFKEAKQYLEKNLIISRKIEDKIEQGVTLSNVGLLYRHQGQYDEAIEYLGESLAINREVGSELGEGEVLNNIGIIYRIKEEYSKALEYYEKSLIIRRKVGDEIGESTTLNNIGLVYRLQGDNVKALEYYEKSLIILRHLGNKMGESTILSNISQVYQDRGEYNIALDYLEKSLVIANNIGNKLNAAISMSDLGVLYFFGLGNVVEAVSWLLQSYNVLQKIGSSDAQVPEKFLNEIREQIGEERFNQIVQSVQNTPPA